VKTLIQKAAALVKDYKNGPDRVRIKLEGWKDRRNPSSSLERVFDATDLEEAVGGILGGSQPSSLPRTPALISLREHIERRKRELIAEPSSFEPSHNGTETLANLCYAICRAVRPRVVVETGVAHGVTSAYILQALSENEQGALFSIDLPPLGSKSAAYTGCFVPEELRSRWSLHIGSARKLLPEIFALAGAPTLFVHDSLHTYAHMKWELSHAMAVLRPGGVLIADDIEGNRAFEEAARASRVASSFAIRQSGKEAVCGAIRMAAE
jgi:predicted O-methyltransferase YrrM